VSIPDAVYFRAHLSLKTRAEPRPANGLIAGSALACEKEAVL
jgi:hypothetical protein